VPHVVSRRRPLPNVCARLSGEKAGLKPDDLILFVNDRVASSCQMWRKNSLHRPHRPVRLTVQRGHELLDLTLQPAE